MHVIAGLVILLREIAVSGLREFLGGIQVSVPVSKLAKWKTTFQMVSLGALILGGRCRAGRRRWAASPSTCRTPWGSPRCGARRR
jgi:phosphatidylglycerophosphate synthase